MMGTATNCPECGAAHNSCCMMSLCSDCQTRKRMEERQKAEETREAFEVNLNEQ